MDNIPGHVLNETAEECQRLCCDAGSFVALLLVVAAHHSQRAAELTERRSRGWKTQVAELETTVHHLADYARQFEAFADDPANADTPAADAEPAPRCASFRRADPNDQTLCTLPRGHLGDHADIVTGPEAITWERKHSGELCNQDAPATIGPLKCGKPLGHDGEHAAPSPYEHGVDWSWTYGQPPVQTNAQRQVCGDWGGDALGNCARHIGHLLVHANPITGMAWAKGVTPPARPQSWSIGRDELGEATYAAIVADFAADGPAVEAPSERAASEYPNQCPSVNLINDDRCMLPGNPPHTGRHTGRHGNWVDIVAADPAPDAAVPVVVAQSDGTTLTLAEQADQQRAALAMPAPAFTIRESDGAAVYTGLMNAPEMAHAATPAAVMVAEIKEEVTATVDNFTGHVPDPASFAPGAFAGAFGMSIGGSTPGAAPAVPLAELLPPSAVPGAPRERYSVSSVEAMEDCGLKFRLKYRDKLGDLTVGWAGVAGTAFHDVCQHVEAAYLESGGAQYAITDALALERDMVALWEPMFTAAIVAEEAKTGIPSTQWRASNSGKENQAWWDAEGPKMVAKYAKWRVGFLGRGWTLLRQPPRMSADGQTVEALGAPAIEVEWSTELAGVPMTGFIDIAWISGDRSEIRLMDYKSGSREGSVFQQRVYGAALRALGATTGFTVTSSLYEARKGAESTPVTLTPDDDAEIGYRVNTAREMDRAGLFPPRPSTFCGGCPVVKACPVAAKR